MGDKYVVTAARCTDGYDASDLWVRVGDTLLDEEFEANSFTVSVASIKQHPDYDYPQNDIAVLELAQPVSLTEYPNIKPACLPEAGALFPGEAIVSGWGKVGEGSHKTSSLHEVGVTVFADEDCGNMIEYMTEGRICAGVVEGGKGTCTADTGGPLVAEDPARNNSMSLIGVVNGAIGCARPGYPSLYAEVSHFIDWLSEEMPDLNTCPPPPEGWNSISGSTDSGSTSVPATTTAIMTLPTTATLTTETETTDPESSTTSKVVTCGNCIFPFVWAENWLIDRCTTIDGDPRPWCAKQVDSEGAMQDYEYCTDPSCPGLEGNSEKMSVHPENAVGNCCKFFI